MNMAAADKRNAEDTMQAMRVQLAAKEALRRISGQTWYDSNFLYMFEAAKIFLRSIRPDALGRFIAGFEPLRTRSDFAVPEIADIFSPEQFQQIRETVAALDQRELEKHERELFGRLVLHDHAWFTQLQADLTDRISEFAGEPLVSSYNFLSLYSGDGRCDPHMDEPEAKWTLDICIDQSAEWPIYVSQPVSWPDRAVLADYSPDRIRSDPGLKFEAKVLRPNQAILFAGSSQWHYRDPIVPGNYCHLLFFHYRPAGCDGLIRPKRWAKHFNLPELDVLAALAESR